MSASSPQGGLAFQGVICPPRFIIGWGSSSRPCRRDLAIRLGPRPVKCLGVTFCGGPRHYIQRSQGVVLHSQCFVKHAIIYGYKLNEVDMIQPLRRKAIILLNHFSICYLQQCFTAVFIVFGTGANTQNMTHCRVGSCV